MEEQHASEAEHPDAKQHESGATETRNATRKFLRSALLPLVVIGFFEIAALSSVPETKPFIWVSNLLVFLYLGWKWEVRSWGSRQQAITTGIAAGFALGFIIGVIKFILEQKFYSLFYLITDPILKGLVGGVMMGAVVTLARSSKLQPLLQRFKHNK